MEELHRAKPASVQGPLRARRHPSSTMGPGVHIDPLLARKIDEDLAGQRLRGPRGPTVAGLLGARGLESLFQIF